MYYDVFACACVIVGCDCVVYGLWFDLCGVMMLLLSFDVLCV